MRLHVSDPRLVLDLLEFLHSRADVVATQIAEDEVEVGLVGSYSADAMRMELYLLVRAWEAGQRSSGAGIELVD